MTENKEYKVQVNTAEVVKKATRMFNGSLSDMLRELLQNARRAGASNALVWVYTKGDKPFLQVQHDGAPFTDATLSSLLNFGGSGWEGSVENEDPAGMGFFSVSCQKDIELSWRTEDGEYALSIPEGALSNVEHTFIPEKREPCLPAEYSVCTHVNLVQDYSGGITSALKTAAVAGLDVTFVYQDPKTLYTTCKPLNLHKYLERVADVVSEQAGFKTYYTGKRRVLETHLEECGCDAIFSTTRESSFYPKVRDSYGTIPVLAYGAHLNLDVLAVFKRNGCSTNVGGYYKSELAPIYIVATDKSELRLTLPARHSFIEDDAFKKLNSVAAQEYLKAWVYRNNGVVSTVTYANYKEYKKIWDGFPESTNFTPVEIDEEAIYLPVDYTESGYSEGSQLVAALETTEKSFKYLGEDFLEMKGFKEYEEFSKKANYIPVDTRNVRLVGTGEFEEPDGEARKVSTLALELYGVEGLDSEPLLRLPLSAVVLPRCYYSRAKDPTVENWDGDVFGFLGLSMEDFRYGARILDEFFIVHTADCTYEAVEDVLESFLQHGLDYETDEAIDTSEAEVAIREYLYAIALRSLGSTEKYRRNMVLVVSRVLSSGACGIIPRKGVDSPVIIVRYSDGEEYELSPKDFYKVAPPRKDSK